MHFYNPFKPHIVEVGTDKYALRKLTSYGWKYMSTNAVPNIWYTDTDLLCKYCLVKSVDEAEHLLPKRVTIKFVKSLKE